MNAIEKYIEGLERETDIEVVRTGAKILSYRLANLVDAITQTHTDMLRNASTAADVAAIEKFYKGVQDADRAGLTRLMVEILLGLSGQVDNGSED